MVDINEDGDLHLLIDALEVVHNLLGRHRVQGRHRLVHQLVWLARVVSARR